MADTEIRRTTGSTPTNEKKFTLSFWLKKSKNGQSSERGILGWRENSNSGNNNLQVQFDSNDKLQVGFYSNNGNDTHIDCITNRQFKDNNSFYHFVIAVDSTQGTSSNRVKIYVNGVQETSFGTATYPAVDRTFFSNDVQINVGKSRTTSDTDRYFNGVISHLHFTDGYTYAASDFGFTDATTGEWRINTSPSVTYGNNGFWWLKDSIATTDHSPNSNTFSVGNGTLTKTEDNPSNVFATWNPLWSQSNGNIGDVTFSHGNTTTITSVDYRTTPATLGMKSGKYYWEIKRNEDTGADLHAGVMSENATPANTATWIGNAANGWVIAGDAGEPYTGGTGGSVISNTAFPNAGDIHMCAYDGATGKLYFGANGTWGGTANPSTGANPHYTLDNSLFYFPCVSTGSDCSANFGNGYFGTTAVSSAGTNAS